MLPIRDVPWHRKGFRGERGNIYPIGAFLIYWETTRKQGLACDERKRTESDRGKGEPFILFCVLMRDVLTSQEREVCFKRGRRMFLALTDRLYLLPSFCCVDVGLMLRQMVLVLSINMPLLFRVAMFGMHST